VNLVIFTSGCRFHRGGLPGVSGRLKQAATVPGKDRRSGVDIPNGEKSATGWPAIIFNHGFIEPDVYRTTECYVAYVDGLARSGYIVLHSISSDAC
jgi:hypothetical protein